MCPACLIAAALVAAKVASGGALGALAVKKLHATLKPASPEPTHGKTTGDHA